MAISFGVSLLFPGVILAIAFAAVMPARECLTRPTSM